MSVSAARSRRAGNRQTREVRARIDDLVDWVRDTWGAEPGVDITLNESPVSLVRQWSIHRGIKLNETAMVQSLKRHPRYERLEGGTGRRPTYVLKARPKDIGEPDIEEPTTTPDTTPEEEPVGTLHHLPKSEDAEPADLLAQAIESVRRAAHAEAEARFEGELAAHQELIRDELRQAQELYDRLGKSLSDVASLMDRWKVEG